MVCIKNLFKRQEAAISEETKTIIIQIGAYKTATSYIQNLFQINRKILLKDHGVLYPQSGLTGSNITGRKHYHLFNAIKNSDPTLLMKLENELKEVQCRIMFLSSENLSRLTIQEIQRLKSYLPNTKIKILYTVRKQDQFIESLYSEYTQHNQNILSFESFIQEQLPLLNFYQTANNWASVFGKENIIVNGFDSNKKKGVIESLFCHMSINASVVPTLRKPTQRNCSIGERDCQLMYNLNHVFSGYKGLKKIGHFIKDQRQKDRPLSLFTETERSTFLDTFTTTNKALIESFGSDAEYELNDKTPTLTYKSDVFRDASFDAHLIKALNKPLLIKLFKMEFVQLKCEWLSRILRVELFTKGL